MTVRFLILPPLILMSAVTACGRCSMISSAEVRPANEIALTVGDTVTAAYWLTGRCGNPPTSPTNVALRWWTTDTLVVRVDSLSGQVRGISAGDAHVWGRYPNGPATLINPLVGILIRVR